MSRRLLLLIAGLGLVGLGAYLVFSPHVVADLLGRPAETQSQKINLRATWGGTLVGFGAFVAWVGSLRPLKRFFLGLAALSMVGIGAARTVGFVVDGGPDALQWVWLIAEVLIAGVCGTLLVRSPQPRSPQPRSPQPRSLGRRSPPRRALLRRHQLVVTA